MIFNINIRDIEDSLPSEYKLKGLNKMGIILQDKILSLQQQIIPSIHKEIIKFDNGCPTNLDSIISKRNNIQERIINFLELINKISKNIEVANNLFNFTFTLIQTLKTSKNIASIAIKATPAAPGIAVAGLSDLDTIIDSLIFDNKGNSKISILQSNIDSVSFNISLTEKLLYSIILLFQQLDILIQNCLNDKSKLDNPPNKLGEFVKSQENSINDISNTLYKGFNIQIETVKFTPTVNRNKAVGYNKQGIKLIETKLSFVRNPTILINELKFQIDKDGLKAY